MIDLSALGTEQIEAMAEAGLEVLECHRVLAKPGTRPRTCVPWWTVSGSTMPNLPGRRTHALRSSSNRADPTYHGCPILGDHLSDTRGCANNLQNPADLARPWAY